MEDADQAARRRSALRSAEVVPSPRATGSNRFALESPGGSEGSLRRTLLSPLPFRIGRKPGLELVLPSQLVSKMHAEIYEHDGGLRVRDLGSANGTFLNRQAVTDEPLREGDILYLADFEFRLAALPRKAEDSAKDLTGATVHSSMLALPRHFLTGTRELRELLDRGNVTMAFQPIVQLPGGGPTAYEALGRGRHPGLPESPLDLFKIASTSGDEAELSRLFRRRAVELVRDLKDPPALFLNTHPAEMKEDELVASLEELRILGPTVDLVLEIHESTLARPDYIARLRERLSEINVGLAYDDFGSGQSRLLELAEAPPHYLKFDRCFITGLEKAPPSRRRFLGALVEACRELRVKTVAEGVETPGEAEACREVGFTHAQGYLFGRPSPAEQQVKQWQQA
jgi:EAL domain-containing protein (putative c-di-GMP-specific phosphodiesterase class I)